MLILRIEISLDELSVGIEKLRTWCWFWVIYLSNWC